MEVLRETLSHQAIQMAAELEWSCEQDLARWLYRFNRIPNSPKWRKTFSTSISILESLDVHDRGEGRKKLDELYHFSPLEHWLSWRNRAKWDEIDRTKPTYKLYISLFPFDLITAFPTILANLIEQEVVSFKVTAHAEGLLRPDKMVVYFGNLKALEKLGNALTNLLSTYNAHGVPFTAIIDEKGILSWGKDPVQKHPNAKLESWRSWICQKIATELIAAKKQNGNPFEWTEIVLDQLQLLGIDKHTFTPSSKLWN